MISSGPALGQSGLAAPTGFSHIRLTALEMVGIVADWPKQNARGWMLQPAGEGRSGLTERSEVRYG